MIAALLLFTVLGSSATAAREELAGSPASPVVYRVSGVVVNSRGAPIPRCTLRLFPLSPEEEERENPGREDRGNGRVGRPGAGRQSDPGGDGSGIRPRGGVGQDASQTTLSDAQGHFSLVLPHGGRWLLSGVARDFRQQRYQQHDAFSTALVLSEQAPALRVEFALKASNSILGSVLDEFGDPVQGGQVVAQRRIVPQESGAPLRWQSGGSVQTDDRGHYELTGLADGVYRLAISAHPWYASGGNVVRAVPSVPATPDAALDVVFPVTWFPGSTEERSADLVSLHGGEEREADFHLQSVPALHITLPRSASPAAANEDGARPERGGIPEITRLTAGSLPFGGGGQFTSVTRDGNWEIGGLAPGTFQVRLPRRRSRRGFLAYPDPEQRRCHREPGKCRA